METRGEKYAQDMEWPHSLILDRIWYRRATRATRLAKCVLQLDCRAIILVPATVVDLDLVGLHYFTRVLVENAFVGVRIVTGQTVEIHST